jgi:phage shock protein E
MKSKVILSALLVSLLFVMGSCTQSSVEVYSAEVSSLLQKNKNIFILDVRTADEFSQGHIKGAVNMDMHLPGMLDSINGLNKDSDYLVYCRTKNRSGIVVNSMIQHGFKTVYQMADGITGWDQNGLPVVK